MRAVAIILALTLVACKPQAEDAPAGNEQAVIDKANADVAAAEAEAAATGQASAASP